MRELLVKARTRVGYAAVGVLVAVAVGGVGTAVVIDNPPTEEVSDVEPVTSEPAETSAPTEPTAVVEPETPVVDGAESPAVVAPADTIGDVTEPQPTVPPGPGPTPETTSDVPVAEQSFGGQAPSPASMPKLPGEVGYISPPAEPAPQQGD